MANWEITTTSTPLNFDTQAAVTDYPSNSAVAIDENHFINFYGDYNGDAIALVFAVNTSTWAVSTASAKLSWDTNLVASLPLASVSIDSNHVMCIWPGSGQDGHAAIFTVNTSTWAITEGTNLEFDTQRLDYPSVCRLDDNHALVAWQDSANDGRCQVLAINTSTWAVTTAAAVLEFETQSDYGNSVVLIDATHIAAFWYGQGGGASNSGQAQIFNVNTTTWEVSTANSVLNFDTAFSTQKPGTPISFLIGDNHALLVYNAYTTSYRGRAQTFTVNTSTWAITTSASVLEFETQLFGDNFGVVKIDTNHFAVYWRGVDSDGFAQVLEVNTTTWAVTTAAASLEFDTQYGAFHSPVLIDTSHIINFFQGSSTTNFYAQSFAVEVPGGEPPAAPTIVSWKTLMGVGQG